MNINIEQVKKKISKLPIEELAKTSGFQKRKPKKIDVRSFVIGFFLQCQTGKWSLNHLAIKISLLIGQPVSKQSVDKKLSFRHEAFAKQLLAYVIKEQAKAALKIDKSIDLFCRFNKVFVQDSTCLNLPRNVAEFYPGAHSPIGKENATARIQLCIELLEDSYQYIDLKSFRDNDQGASSDILPLLNEGDLLIRDMGYFSLSTFKSAMEKKAHILSRLRYKVNIYDVQSKKKLDLAAILKHLEQGGTQVLDQEVLVEQKAQLKLRLVAIKAPDKIAKARIAKAKKDRRSTANHDEAYYELLGWTIFVTSVEEQTWTFKDILKAYQFRWRIEVIFKCWKQYLGLDKLFDNKASLSPPRVTMTIYLNLVWITIAFCKWYNFFAVKLYQNKQKFISILKFADFVKEHFCLIISADNLEQFIDLVEYFCTYDKRKKSQNYLQLLYES